MMHEEAESLVSHYSRFVECVDELLETEIRNAYTSSLESAAQAIRRRVVSALLSDPIRSSIVAALGGLQTERQARLVDALDSFVALQGRKYGQDTLCRTPLLDRARVIVHEVHGCLAPVLLLSTLHTLGNLDSLLALGQEDSHAWAQWSG